MDEYSLDSTEEEKEQKIEASGEEAVSEFEGN